MRQFGSRWGGQGDGWCIKECSVGKKWGVEIEVATRV